MQHAAFKIVRATAEAVVLVTIAILIIAAEQELVHVIR